MENVGLPRLARCHRSCVEAWQAGTRDEGTARLEGCVSPASLIESTWKCTIFHTCIFVRFNRQKARVRSTRTASSEARDTAAIAREEQSTLGPSRRPPLTAYASANTATSSQSSSQPSPIFSPLASSIAHYHPDTANSTGAASFQQHFAEMAEIRRKLVIVGDGACGKTCLLMYVRETSSTGLLHCRALDLVQRLTMTQCLLQGYFPRGS